VGGCQEFWLGGGDGGGLGEGVGLRGHAAPVLAAGAPGSPGRARQGGGTEDSIRELLRFSGGAGFCWGVGIDPAAGGGEGRGGSPGGAGRALSPGPRAYAGWVKLCDGDWRRLGMGGWGAAGGGGTHPPGFSGASTRGGRCLTGAPSGRGGGGRAQRGGGGRGGCAVARGSVRSPRARGGFGRRGGSEGARRMEVIPV